MMYFRPEPSQLDPSYLLHSIYGPVARNYIENATNGSTVGHLRLGQVGNIPLIWCPLNEQQSIAEYIDREMARIDASIGRHRREIDLMQEYRTRLISDVVTGRLDVRGVQLPPIEKVIGEEMDAAMEEEPIAAFESEPDKLEES